MKGSRTVIMNAGIAALAAGLPILAGYDWSQDLSPMMAVVVTTALNVFMRFITTTPIFNSR